MAHAMPLAKRTQRTQRPRRAAGRQPSEHSRATRTTAHRPASLATYRFWGTPETIRADLFLPLR